MDEVVSYNLLGLIIYDNNFIILWISLFIKNCFGRKWVGYLLVEFFNYYEIYFDNNL